MHLAANKDLVRDYLARNNIGDLNGCLALVSDTDFELVCRALPPIGYRLDRANFGRVLRGARDAMRGPLQITIEQMTAEDNRVAVQANSRAELAKGGEYHNTYHFLFTIRGGRIVRIDEYLCSYTMSKLLDPGIWELHQQGGA
jgi:ketosteroid isomerase-like protein